MQLDFAPFAYGRPGKGVAEAKTVNVFWEVQPGSPSKYVLFGRPGLTQSLNKGNGPVNGAFCADGVFSGDRFFASGVDVYREGNSIGSLTLGTTTRFAASSTELVAASGGAVKVYDGSTFDVITIPDGRTCVDVFILGARFFYVCSDGRIYWSALGDAATIPGDFVSASSSPDGAVGGIATGSEAVIFGSETTEFWPLTTNPDAPISRSIGRTYQRGCAGLGTVQAMDNGFLWVGDDRVVYRSGGVPIRVSTHEIEAQLRACTAIDESFAFRAQHEGHLFYVLRIPGQGTWAFDLATQKWAQWRSFGRDNFRGVTSLSKDGVTYIGDALSGRLWKFDPDAYTDGDEPIERIASGKVSLTREAICHRVELLCAKGTGLEDGTDSNVELTYSDDEGRSFCSPRVRSVGDIGAYRTRVRWNALGQMRVPGRIFEFRTTSPNISAFTAVLLNEQ